MCATSWQKLWYRTAYNHAPTITRTAPHENALGSHTLCSSFLLHNDVTWMQDDMMGNPDVGGLNEALLADMAAPGDADAEEDSMNEASVEASIEDGDDSCSDDTEGDADSPAVGLAGTQIGALLPIFLVRYSRRASLCCLCQSTSSLAILEAFRCAAAFAQSPVGTECMCTTATVHQLDSVALLW